MPKGLSDRRVNVTRVTFEKGGKALLIAAADCAENAPCLVCFHGGGFVFGAARYHYENAKRYALMAGCKVLFVRYPLAPGNPWPAPNDACLAAYRHALSHARELGIDAEKGGGGGDSAGGFLAAFYGYAHVERAAECKNVGILCGGESGHSAREPGSACLSGGIR